MPSRPLRSGAVAVAVASLALLANGCSSSPERVGDPDGEHATAASALGPSSCPAFEPRDCEEETSNDDNWDNIHSKKTTTYQVCSCSSVLGPNDPTCGTFAHTCGATLAVPPELPGCTAGVMMTDAPFNTWLCPDGTHVPDHVTAPCPSASCEKAIEVVVPYHGAVCTTCGGDPPSGYFFVEQYYIGTGSIAGPCPGGCGLGVPVNGGFP